MPTQYQPEIISSAEAAEFIATHNLPEPTYAGIAAIGMTTTDLLKYPMVDGNGLAVMKRLAEDPSFNDQLIADILARSILSDDPFYTLYNSFIIADYFNQTGLTHSLDEREFVLAVAGLSQNNGDKGFESMHRLCDPAEIEGAAAVIRFISVMNHYEKMVKLALLKHPASSGVSGLVISNRWVDRLVRSHPEHFDAIREFLIKRPVKATKKAAQPLYEYFQSNNPTALLNGIL